MTTRQASGAELSDSGASPTRSTTLEKAEDSAAESEIRPKRRSLRQASQEKTETSEPGKSPTNRKTSPEHKPSESDPGTCPKRPKVVQDKPDPGAESSPTRHIAKGLTTEGETPEKEKSPPRGKTSDSDTDDGSDIYPEEAFGKALDKITFTLGALLNNVEETTDKVCSVLEAHQSSVGFFKAWLNALTAENEHDESFNKDDDGSRKPQGTTSESESLYSEIL